MRYTQLPSRKRVPVLGLATWHMGERPENRQDELDAIRSAVDSGMNVIDTAERYGDGAAESLIGEALDIPLSPQDLAAPDRAFPPPGRKVPLEVI
jgi:aryl-alcohol dehydrogenase-like predicted oxidoreductase